MHSKRFAIFALALLSTGITARAQSNAISLSFSGTGFGTALAFFLNGTGTFTPLGTASVTITGVPIGNGASLAFAFQFPDGTSLAADGGSTSSGSGLSGTATITGGTGALAGTIGSFTFTITAPFSGSSFNFTFTGSGTMGQPATCAYTLDTGGEAFPAAGGNGTVNITAPAGCAWSLSGPPAWVINSTSGSGNGTLTYQVTANPGADRSATMTIGGVSYEVEQESTSLSGLNFIGSMPHLAALENWTTAFTMVNKGGSAATARLSLFGDAVDPTGNGPLLVPLAFPQQAFAAAPKQSLPALSGPLLAATFDRTLAANASLIVNTAGAQVPPVLVGSAQLAATGAVDGFAIFHLIPGAQEAVVPMETRNASSYLLAFDNTGGVVLGIAVENVSAQAAVIPVVIRDETGAVISPAGTTLSLAGNGHTSFVLSLQYPMTANIRGTIEFDTPAGGQISVLGIRTTPLGNSTTLTTIPALANVGMNGGSIAHIATGNGWQTTFVIVNTGTTSAQAHLKFFMDNGTPLSIPIGPPGGAATSTAATVDQTLAAGAMLTVQSAAPLSDPTPTIGSAQLTTDGHVGGFVIFRYNPNGQEAVVPLENRNANASILAFDNTAGTATGVAINSVSAQSVNIPVIVRDDAGAQLATDTITLAANGHLAFTLGSDKYQVTAGIRGTIEFDTPAGAQIGALGIRIPIAHTFTTLPALVR